jgi:hypothetical protein
MDGAAVLLSNRRSHRQRAKYELVHTVLCEQTADQKGENRYCYEKEKARIHSEQKIVGVAEKIDQIRGREAYDSPSSRNNVCIYHIRQIASCIS